MGALAYTAVWLIFFPAGAMCRLQCQPAASHLDFVKRYTTQLNAVDPELHACRSSGRMSRQNAHRLEPASRAAPVLPCLLLHQQTHAILQQQEATRGPSTAARSSLHLEPTGEAQIARPKWRSAACAHARQYTVHIS